MNEIVKVEFHVRNIDIDCIFQDVYATLQDLFRPLNLDDLYAFHYTPSADEMLQVAGWTLYEAEAEYMRMGLPADRWHASLINSKYDVRQCAVFLYVLHLSISVTVSFNSFSFSVQEKPSS